MLFRPDTKLAEEMEEFCVQEALKQIRIASPSNNYLGGSISESGIFGRSESRHHFAWDLAFLCLWAKHFHSTLPLLASLDAYYAFQDEDGFLAGRYTEDGESWWAKIHPASLAPPILSWAELELHSVLGDNNRLSRVYENLKKYHFFLWEQKRQQDGLFYGDAEASQMDNLPRWPENWQGDQLGLSLMSHHIHRSVHRDDSRILLQDRRFSWNRQGRLIDFSAQIALDASCLGEMARILGRETERKLFNTHWQLTAEAINSLCWNCEQAFYFDLAFDKQIERMHVGSYWTLLAGVVPPNRIDAYVSHLLEARHFGTPMSVPSLARSEKEYEFAGERWRGGVWPSGTAMVLSGLRRYGQTRLAREVAMRFYQSVSRVFVSTGSLWENYSAESPMPGRPAKNGYWSWNGIGPVFCWREFLRA